jgi:hypothetical protein
VTLHYGGEEWDRERTSGRRTGPTLRPSKAHSAYILVHRRNL